jgi:hypothetical protein
LKDNSLASLESKISKTMNTQSKWYSTPEGSSHKAKRPENEKKNLDFACANYISGLSGMNTWPDFETPNQMAKELMLHANAHAQKGQC